MKTYMTPEEHARLHRRRARQALGLLVAVLVLVGAVTVVRAGVRTVANLFDDTQQRQEYEDKLEGLVLFDPVPFDGIENIDDLTLREAAVWGCVYSIQETQGGFDNYNTDPDTEQLFGIRVGVVVVEAALRILNTVHTAPDRRFTQGQVVDVLDAVERHRVEHDEAFQLVLVFFLLLSIVEEVCHDIDACVYHRYHADENKQRNDKAQRLTRAAAVMPGMFFWSHIGFHKIHRLQEFVLWEQTAPTLSITQIASGRKIPPVDFL